jgi:hypothetical protein
MPLSRPAAHIKEVGPVRHPQFHPFPKQILDRQPVPVLAFVTDEFDADDATSVIETDRDICQTSRGGRLVYPFLPGRLSVRAFERPYRRLFEPC